MTTQVRPIGATDSSPLVVLTTDISRFVKGHLEVLNNSTPNYDKMVQRIRAAKEAGQLIHGVSYEVLKKIYDEAAPITAQSCADEILTTHGEQDRLGKDIPIYRNPMMSDEKYLSVMRQRLADDDWDEEQDETFIKSFPKVN